MTQRPNNLEHEEVLEVGWHPYALDHAAQELVLKYRDEKNVLNESHKMRMAVAYGLERFWGEHLRFERDNSYESQNKGRYWKSVWMEVAKILDQGNIALPDADGLVTFKQTSKIKEIAAEIWQLSESDRYVALMVLTQFCDALVWWTQRYKT
ncbi:MAG: hypothetical protein F6K30_02600 [Cyanothece sp. SIO2G6]|nr:hypothetical protein [Cyanothece sp. SIO2G6]